MFPHYLSKIIDQLLPVYYLVVVELAEEPAPAHASLRVHLSQTSVDGAEGQLVDHSAQFLVVEVLDQTGIVVRVEEVLLVDACSHKLQHLLRLILPQQLIHLLEDELEVGLELQLCDLFSLGGGDVVGVVPEVVEQSLEVEEVLDVEVDQLALHHGLDPLENGVDPGSGRKYLVWVGSER